MKAAWLAVLVGAALVRVGLMAGTLGRLDDPDNYLLLATSLAEGRGLELHGRPTAYRPPLYPILLAPLMATLPRVALPWGIGGLHLALGIGTVLLVRRAALAWGLSPIRALAAGAVVAFDPVLAIQCRSVMTETLAAFLVAATLVATASATAKGAFLGGIGFGLASLCRPSFLPAAILAGLAGLVVGTGGAKDRIVRSGLIGLATLVVLAPWAWRNARVLGEPVWTTTHGGYTLALANNPVYYAEVLDSPQDTVWSGPNQAAWFDQVGRSTEGMSEPQADRVLRDQATRMLLERPVDFARASLGRLGRFWGLAPSAAVYPRSQRMIVAAWTTPLWALLALGLLDGSNWRWPRVVAPSLLLSLTMVHLAYWTDLRMRAPIVPAIALVAASALPGRHLGHLVDAKVVPS